MFQSVPYRLRFASPLHVKVLFFLCNASPFETAAQLVERGFLEEKPSSDGKNSPEDRFSGLIASSR
jgi:hypothetical protein